MNQARIDLLKKYIEEDPSDPFNYYGLACEYLQGDPEKSLSLFKNLLKNHPSYLATYYQAAQLFASFELEEEAIQVYKSGIELAEAQKNGKTLQELKTAYQNLLFEM